MIISDFTKPEIDYLKENCNFVNLEIPLFDMRSQGITLEVIAEELNISIDTARKISQKVNKKIIKVLFISISKKTTNTIRYLSIV